VPVSVDEALAEKKSSVDRLLSFRQHEQENHLEHVGPSGASRSDEKGGELRYCRDE